MRSKLSLKQIEAVDNLTAKERYDHSIKMIADSEELFSLIEDSGNWVIAGVESREAFFLWSDPGHASSSKNSESWKGSKIERIALDEFDQEILNYL